MIGINQFPQFSMKNRHLVEQSTSAGCFHCCKIFTAKEITKYTDNNKTCLCPFCEIDSVVGISGFDITEDLLKKAKKYWYNQSS
jgi:hypothetical protein